MGLSDRIRLFDDWAGTYDDGISQAETDSFPFAGYTSVLARIARLYARLGLGRILDLGIGTGNQSACIRKWSPATEIWGVDFSGEMLTRAEQKLPGIHLLQADIAYDLPQLVLPRFDGVACSYVLHELSDGTKVDVIEYLLRNILRPSGVLVVGDIAFRTQTHMEAVRIESSSSWDETEHYFIVDEFLPLLRARDIAADFEQVSNCAGVFTFEAS